MESQRSQSRLGPLHTRGDHHRHAFDPIIFLHFLVKRGHPNVTALARSPRGDFRTFSSSAAQSWLTWRFRTSHGQFICLLPALKFGVSYVWPEGGKMEIILLLLLITALLPQTATEPAQRTVVISPDSSAQDILKAVSRSLHRDRDFKSLAGVSAALWDENVRPGEFRLSQIDDAELLRMLAHAHARLGEWKGAARVLKRDSAVSPSDAGCLYRLSLAYLAIDSDPFLQAQAATLRRVAAQARAGDAARLQANRKLDQPSVAEARKELLQRLESYFKSWEALDESHKQLGARQLEAAYRAAETAQIEGRAALDWDLELRASEMLGLVAQHANDLPRAFSNMNRAVAVAIGAGDLQEASVCLEALADLVQLLRTIDSVLASVYSVAEVVLGPPVVREKVNTDAAGHLERAMVADRSGQTATAIAEYQLAMADHPREPRAYANLAADLLSMPAAQRSKLRTALAKLLLRTALAIDPGNEAARGTIKAHFGEDNSAPRRP